MQILAVKASNHSIQQTLGGVTTMIDVVNKAMAASTTWLKDIPSKRELRQHQDLMDEHWFEVEEINPGLTTAMESYKVSNSAPLQFKQPGGL
jgi:hypothetical protein